MGESSYRGVGSLQENHIILQKLNRNPYSAEYLIGLIMLYIIFLTCTILSNAISAIKKIKNQPKVSAFENWPKYKRAGASQIFCRFAYLFTTLVLDRRAFLLLKSSNLESRENVERRCGVAKKTKRNLQI